MDKMDLEQVVCPLCEASECKKDTSLSKTQDLLICDVCGLYFVQPMPLSTKIYNQDYFRAWGMSDGALPDHVYRLKEETMRWHLNQIRRFFDKGEILEVGSAMGSFLKLAQEQGFDVKGIEVSEKACEIARSKVGGENVFNGTLESANIKPSSFDVLFMSDVIEHIPEPLPFLEKAFNSIRKGGIIYFTTPDPNHWSRKFFGKNWVHYKDEHLMFLSLKTFDWIADHFGLYLFDFSPSQKYADLNYLSYQLEHFDYKLLGVFSRLIRRVIPNRMCEALVPISIGESRCILFKPTF
jgi:SAM-dependent methyltransferase